MSGITGDIKKLFNFKYKARHDSVSDQYNRLFMVKAMLVGAFLTGMSWYKDDVKCVVPKQMDTSNVAGYGPKACWINGFYVYDELRHEKQFTGYYGLPLDMSDDGYRYNSKKDLETCDTNPINKDKIQPDCIKMKKKFYLQYQWFPFYLAVLAFMYYIPYICFKFANSDLISLKNSIKKQNAEIDEIATTYFSGDKTNTAMGRVIGNIAIKIGYLIINVLVFVFTDSVLNGEFKKYGTKWNKWSDLNNSAAYNYVGQRNQIKPGEMLLPVFGFCDVLELGLDIKHGLFNEYHLVCELSQHVLYHYVLIALWWLIIFGMILSILGIVEMLVSFALRQSFFANEEEGARRVYSRLSLREAQYLDFVRKKNMLYYGELIRKLLTDKFSSDASSDGASSKDTRF